MSKMLCKCGCGKKVKLGNLFINGHNRRGLHFNHTRKTKEKIGKAHAGVKHGSSIILESKLCECGCRVLTRRFFRVQDDSQGNY